jgi:hypothetical protein
MSQTVIGVLRSTLVNPPKDNIECRSASLWATSIRDIYANEGGVTENNYHIRHMVLHHHGNHVLHCILGNVHVGSQKHAFWENWIYD